MPLNRFWSSVVSVAGFLLIIGWLQYLFSIVVGLFGILPRFAPDLDFVIQLVAAGVLPIWSALTFIDWKWGWKGDNAGLRVTPAAAFWYLPGLLGGVLAVALVWVLAKGFTAPVISVSGVKWLWLGFSTLLQVFVTELVYRGIVTSRFQHDLSGWERLAAATLVPPLWMLIQGTGFLAMGWPVTFIGGMGTVALSVFLTLLFLRLDSVWLSAGLHSGLLIGLMLLGLARNMAEQSLFLVVTPQAEQSLFLLFAPLAGVLLYLEWKRMGPIRRPSGGPGRGPKRVVYGKTVRGPWGPH